VLGEVARRLQNAVRSCDMVGRYGGEEFLVALNRCHSGSAVSRAEHLLGAIGIKPFLVEEKRLTVTISVGLALANEFSNCSVDEIMNHADLVLYAAIAAGRNYVRVALPPAAAQNEAQGTESTVLVPRRPRMPKPKRSTASPCRGKAPSSGAWPPRNPGRGVRARLPGACRFPRYPKRASDS
jgi:hypothetical protein